MIWILSSKIEDISSDMGQFIGGYLEKQFYAILSHFTSLYVLDKGQLKPY